MKKIVLSLLGLCVSLSPVLAKKTMLTWGFTKGSQKCAGSPDSMWYKLPPDIDLVEVTYRYELNSPVPAEKTFWITASNPYAIVPNIVPFGTEVNISWNPTYQGNNTSGGGSTTFILDCSGFGGSAEQDLFLSWEKSTLSTRSGSQSTTGGSQLGVTAQKMIETQIFPNPLVGQGTILSPIKDCRVCIYDIAGRKVKEFSLHNGTATLQQSDYVPGIYQAVIAGISRQSFIVQ